MRKSLLLTFVLSLCVADFSAFAATRSNARGTVSNAAQSQSANTARAAVSSQRQRVAQASPSNSEQKKVTTRAATQKALNLGTKVSTATANTVVTDACQNAFYGCMDTFCMLDNAAGGRCQCSDRVVELNAVLDEIMRIDEQSTLIATEGVERVQMGEYADQINSRAKSIESGIGSGASKNSAQRTYSGDVLGLSLFSDGSLFDNGIEEEPVFVSSSSYDMANKMGDTLQIEAVKICIAQIPAECKNSSTLLQMAYAQKVKSDCIGYENALKQQKSASQQKLLAAQKAVRDAVLTEVREQNKYATTGECAIAFAQCMQTTAECGSDYTGCVTLAASENVKNNKSGSKAKQTTIKGVVSGADVTLAATTMEQLLAKKEICASVTRQCVNANRNDAVWSLFLRNVAPALKSAELVAEQNLRSNCIPTVAECFKTACRSQFLDNDESYDMCLSDPKTYKSLCKVQLEPCLEATGGTYDKPEDSSLWNGLIAMLNSMKVDVCTKEVKDCLTERCGADYSGCIGLDTYSMGNLCPVEKLTACVTNGRFSKRNADGTVDNEDEIRKYVAQIAQGLALQIDNSLAEACQNAADQAMIKVCGDNETCDGLSVDLSTLKSLMTVQACSLKYNAEGEKEVYCLPDPAQFSDDEVYSMGYSSLAADAKLVRKNNNYGVYATLLNRPDFSSILFGEGANNNIAEFYSDQELSVDGKYDTMADTRNFSKKSTDTAVGILQGVLDRMMQQIDSDPKVVYCKTGRKVQGFDGNYFGKTEAQGGRFENLTDKYKYVIANSLLNKIPDLEKDFEDEIQDMDSKIAKRVAEIAKKRGDAVEAVIDARNYQSCKSQGSVKTYRDRSLYKVETASSYDAETNICTVKKTRYLCLDSYWNQYRCEDDGWDSNGVSLGVDNIQMPKFQ